MIDREQAFKAICHQCSHPFFYRNAHGKKPVYCPGCYEKRYVKSQRKRAVECWMPGEPPPSRVATPLEERIETIAPVPGRIFDWLDDDLIALLATVGGVKRQNVADMFGELKNSLAAHSMVLKVHDVRYVKGAA